MKKLAIQDYLPTASPLAFGCMGLGGGWNDPDFNDSHIHQAHAAVDAALESGITFFDHADIYSRGKAERVFAEVLKSRPSLRDKILIQSKCAIRLEDDQAPGRYDFSRDWILSSVDGILSRLGCEHLDVLLLHRPDPLMEPEEVAEAFGTLKQQGKVSYFGVSNMHQQQMAFLQHHLDMPLVANQIEISLQQTAWLDEGITAGNPAGNNVNFAPGTLEYCRLNNVQIQSWGSLCQGLFSGRELSGESPQIQQTADLVARLAADYGVSREAIVLAFLRRHPAGIQPVIGTTNPERIKACAEVDTLTLSREHWYTLYVTSRGERMP